ncbi:hypothetical protein Y1Q_0018508 [Alligator mississippiensis]|uniref:Uncharacterized protein n=1 Tax=Alligator mississippiensis TaxID=8496 RepID=A0A151NDQ5_ALLMI|nr:hypothetical protein Y1Q_0018508 [Alligator mississippiensis]
MEKEQMEIQDEMHEELEVENGEQYSEYSSNMEDLEDMGEQQEEEVIVLLIELLLALKLIQVMQDRITMMAYASLVFLQAFNEDMATHTGAL